MNKAFSCVCFSLAVAVARVARVRMMRVPGEHLSPDPCFYGFSGCDSGTSSGLTVAVRS